MDQLTFTTATEKRPSWQVRLRRSRSFMDALYIVFGSLLQAFAYSVFLAPANIVPGGVYGMTIAINHLTKGIFDFAPDGLPIGTMALFFNIPLLILATRKLGLSSGGKTIATFVLISFFTDIISSMMRDHGLLAGDRLLSAFYGGAILGVGVFFIFKAGSTSAGTDVLGRVIAKGRNLKLSDCIIVIDSLVVIFGLIAFKDWTVPLYSWLTILVYGKVVEFLQPENPKKAMFIVSAKSDIIKDFLLNKMGLRGTLLKGKGMYMGDEREVIFTITERKMMTKIKIAVKEIDPMAFISTMDASHDVMTLP